jgi:transcriptional regulator with GAF, ATPase, and Fis domain
MHMNKRANGWQRLRATHYCSGSRRQERNSLHEYETDAQTDADETLFKRQNVKEARVDVEREMIRKALAEANGSVTYAAPLLGLTYPGLIYIIQHRHPELMKERTPARRRKRRPQ